MSLLADTDYDSYSAVSEDIPVSKSVRIVIGLVIAAIVAIAIYVVIAVVLTPELYQQVQFKDEDGTLFAFDFKNRILHMNYREQGANHQIWYKSGDHSLVHHTSHQRDICTRTYRNVDNDMEVLLDVSIPSEITNAERTKERKEVGDILCDLWKGYYTLNGERVTYRWAVADMVVHQIVQQESQDNIQKQRFLEHKILKVKHQIFDYHNVCETVIDDENDDFQLNLNKIVG
ncbi:hypothetical protein P9112_009720 [Eukaryota sp. TZLM1-RC]